MMSSAEKRETDVEEGPGLVAHLTWKIRSVSNREWETRSDKRHWIMHL